VEFERPHRGVSRKKLLQKFIKAHCLLILLSEQNLSDSNFGSVPLMRYVTVVAIWCRWPDTPWWHAKAQEFVHGPDVVC
jgi:hypothetical protein